MLSSKLIAALFGVTFVLAGLLGFLPNPIVSPHGIFAVNAAHNLVHILTGLAFIAGGYFGHGRKTLLGIGAAYVVVTIIGFMTQGDMLLGVIHINEADRWLHAALAAVILLAGFVAAEEDEVRAAGPRPS